ncbi:replication initiation protein [Acinetobacter indicus]|uniref:replication initiation protein n=1 Tax=Acinetobacter indicus TaxID=756892 RepID=UPI00136325B8|nr:replication initiation protein [Acinetobacter indicus]
MAISLKKAPLTTNFSARHTELFPLVQPEKKYPKELAVFQNIFWKLTHEKPLKDDLLKLLFFFSPKVRQVENDLLSERYVFSITATEYSELTGLKKDSCYVALSRAVDTLYEHSVKFYHEETKEIIRTRLISYCGYKEGTFSVSFTHYALHIMSVFNKDNPFTQLKIRSVMPLSGYALKMYPLFLQNEFRKVFEVDLINLKSALNIEPDAYSDFKDFKKKVLKPSIDLINVKTELSISYKAIKKGGRKASHVEFTIGKVSPVKIKSESTKLAPEPAKKIGAITIFKALTAYNLLERFIEHGESSDDLINRIKHDIKNDKTDYWIYKLKEFGITL